MFSFDKVPDPSMLDAGALENVRAMVAWKKQDAVSMSNSAHAHPIRSVGIIGAGVMGAEIAAAYIKHNLPVTIFDNNPTALSTITDRTSSELAPESNNGDIRSLVGRLLCPVGELSRFVKCDLIIESIQEKLSTKQEFLRLLQKSISPDALLVSNTSTIPIKKLAESVALPERFCGMHFFHPVRQRPLVEIIRGPKTSDQTVASIAAHAKIIEKLPIVVADGPGFLVNRLLLPYLTEALELLMEGASIESIESAATQFGMAKGPFRMMDEIGLDTTLHAGWSMAADFGDRITISPLLVTLIKLGRLGQKSGAGFFSYADPQPSANPAQPDPAVIEIIARWAKITRQYSAEDIILRLLMPMIAEAANILKQSKVSDPRNIDLGAIYGLGFPARRGGLLWWANTIKPAMPVNILHPLESMPGPHSKPLLWDLTVQGDSFTGNFAP